MTTFVFHIPVGELASEFHAFLREHGLSHREPRSPNEAAAWRHLRNASDEYSEYDADGVVDIASDAAAVMMKMTWHDYLATPWSDEFLESERKRIDKRMSAMRLGDAAKAKLRQTLGF